MRRLVAAWLLALPLAAAAKSVDVPPPRPEVALLAALPAQLADFRRAGHVNDFAQTTRDARLGAAIEYRSSLGIVATVYLNDAGRSDIGGPGTPALLGQQLAQGL